MKEEKYEIVITGMSGKFPESENISEFASNLFNSVDMVREHNDRWPSGAYNIPTRYGAIKDLSKFDSIFFGIHAKQVNVMDPQLRILMELTYEAIVDSGLFLCVFIGASTSETHDYFCDKMKDICGYEMTGCTRSMFANRISYFYDLNGPSYTVDTACSSGMVALDNARTAIEIGLCDAAIVGASGILIRPSSFAQFNKLGMLSKTGKCHSFDSECDGYVRSDALGVIILQKSTNARRIYADLVYSKHNTDGFKEQGVTYPSGNMQAKLFKEIYNHIDLDPSKVGWIEAHGTGTKVGDPEEVNSIASVFLSKDHQSNRSGPLYLTSVKSNCGHSEPASGLVALIRVLICMRYKKISPNLHYNSPNPDIPALGNGLHVVTGKCINWPVTGKDNYVGINSFGFGGANVHALLKYPKSENIGSVLDKKLIIYSGRNENTLKETLNDISKISCNIKNLQFLENTIYSEHDFRGYVLAEGGLSDLKCEEPIIAPRLFDKPYVVYIFSGMGCQWIGMGLSMMHIKVFRNSLIRINTYLTPFNIDIFDLLNETNAAIYESIVKVFVMIASIQIALVDLLDHIGVKPNMMIGHSVGELGCSYADGGLTAQQTVLAAYYRGMAVERSNLPKGAMAAIGISWKETNEMCPENVYPACNNCDDSVTISGNDEDVKMFVKNLDEKNIFARNVNSSSIAFHSPHMKLAAPALRKYLKKLIPDAKAISEKWISTSNHDTKEQRFCSADYHVNNLISPVRFHEATMKIPKNSLVIEVAAHNLLQSILKRSLNSCTIIGLMNRKNTNIDYLLNSLGQCFLAGLQFNPSLLFSDSIEYPMTDNIDIMSPLIKWDHSTKWVVASSLEVDYLNGKSRNKIEISYNVSDGECDAYIKNHIIDGRSLFPATGYVYTVWKAFAQDKGKSIEDLSVEIFNVNIKRAVILPDNGLVTFEITFLPDSNKFILLNKSSVIVTGEICELGDTYIEKKNPEWISAINNELSEDVITFTHDEAYTYLRVRGYDYNEEFRLIQNCTTNSLSANIKWDGLWIPFMDNMLQMSIFSQKSNALFIPVSIKSLTINPKLHKSFECGQIVEYKKVKYENVCECGGIVIEGLTVNKAPRKIDSEKSITETYKFVEFNSSNVLNDNIENLLNCENSIIVFEMLNLIFDNMKNPNILNVHDFTDMKMFKPIKFWINTQPLISSNYTVSLVFDESLVQKYNLKISDFVENDVGLIIINSNSDNLEKIAKRPLKQDLFLLVIDNVEMLHLNKFDVAYHRVGRNGSATLYLKRASKEKTIPTESQIIRINNDEFSWVEKIKNALILNQNRIWIISNFKNSGIIGLMKCLRRESLGYKFRCFWNVGGDFSVENEKFIKCVNGDLTYNILQDGRLGFMAHCPSIMDTNVITENAYVNTLMRGDLSSLRWIQSPLYTENDSKKYTLCDIIYSSLNFRDIMLATGRLSPESIPGNFQLGDPILGLEFSGYSQDEKIMGIVPAKGLATNVLVNKSFIWKIPELWTMAQAATVPVVYTTAYYSLIVRGNIKKGEWVLIHSGSGGVGQASIRIAHSIGCNIITTVGSDKKKQILLSLFPWLKPEHITDSRNFKNFQSHVLNLTKGYGVDVVLNSLSGQFLQVSLDLIADHGRFLEIGKADLSNNSKLGMSVFLRNISFHGILLDSLMSSKNCEWPIVSQLLKEGIESGVVLPLCFTKFNTDQLEEAFRYMATGKHIGKVLINVNSSSVNALRKTYCCPDKEYILFGGLGGIGLEFCEWLISRGAKNITLTSRSGIKNSYQKVKLAYFIECGVNLKIEKINISNSNEMLIMLNKITKNREIDGVFNLAAITIDAMMENQTAESFSKVCEAKYSGTLNLDNCLRQLQFNPRWFVCFSSISCGRGNAGQCNYGFANSAMESICKSRRDDGLNGVAIQWGAVGDVGMAISLIGSNSVSIGGTMPQRIPSVLTCMDKILSSNSETYSVFSLADKTISDSAKEFDMMMALAKILGVADLSVLPLTSKLSTLGLDSLMTVEIKQFLENKYDLSLNSKEIRNLTLSDINLISEAGSLTENEPKSIISDPLHKEKLERKRSSIVFKKNIANRYNIAKLVADDCIVLMNKNGSARNGSLLPKLNLEENDIVCEENRIKQKNLHCRIVSNASSSGCSATDIGSISSIDSAIISEPDSNAITKSLKFNNYTSLFIVHPLEGTVQSLYELAKYIKGRVYGVQCCRSAPLTNINDLAMFYIQVVEIKKIQPIGPYRLAGYSYGCNLVVVIAHILEQQCEHIENIYFLDGSHKYVYIRMREEISNISNQERVIFTRSLCYFTNQFLSIDIPSFNDELLALPSQKEQLQKTVSMIQDHSPIQNERDIIDAHYIFQKLLFLCLDHRVEFKLKTKNIIFVRSTDNSNTKLIESDGEDFGLQSVCEEKIKIHVASGDHTSFITGSNALKLAKTLKLH
ncbi:hypothetical protein A3Q56_03845 [Intoshia linei]|uniref:Fatty acid synthase n=1 Tax=Intoshia linei TaxID=1819745 RepID=A0A177B2C3_9BILA|nr:hypothetical protein A3Q56_03845 [Intoshia linei]